MDFPVDLAKLVGVLQNVCEKLVPDADLPPAIETAGNGLPRAIALRQVAPGSPRAQDPQDAVDDAPVIDGGPACMRFLRGQIGLDVLSLLVTQFTTVHIL